MSASVSAPGRTSRKSSCWLPFSAFSEISKLKGIKELSISYEKSSDIVKFDSKQITIVAIVKTINSTGYKVIKYSFVA